MMEIFLVLLAVAVLTVPLGIYVARVMNAERVWLTPVLGPVEQLIYRAIGVSALEESGWRNYALNVLLFSFFGFVFLFSVLLLQGLLPLNPAAIAGVEPGLAFNISISFLTNTNWQSYSGENTLSPFSQMVGLAVQNFLSAAVGLAVVAALFRSFRRKQARTIGNFWADVTRAVLYILLPLSLLFGALLISQGVPQSADAPVATQVAIKMIGSNGGGYFNANGAHPLENPTPLANFISMVFILLLPAAIIYAFGVMVADRRQGIALIASVTLIFLPLLWVALSQESTPNPLLASLPLDMASGNMEGKEVRIGLESSVLWALSTTATSNGSVNATMSSLMPITGMMNMVMMMLGEVVFGGVGSGMVGLLMFVIVTVFIGGLMVGRTPEFLGKKLGPFEIKMASIIIILPCALALGGTALALMADSGRAGMMHSGPHGFSEVLYAFTSAANNNGSAFGGLSANSPFYNTLLGVAMFMGRFFIIICALAVAGSLAAKNIVPASNGTMPTHGALFVCMLVGVIVILGLLTFAPALALGPLVEHLQLMHGGAL